jgi:peptide/nickel transport system substrate-binding protein
VRRLRHGREASLFARNFERGIALIVALLALAACGRSAPPRADGAKVVILPREVDELDPRYVGDAYGLKLSRLLYASLVTIDPHTLSPRLDLAERIDQDPEARRYTVTLRPGLCFADGSALDAHDVEATFRAIVDAKVKSRYRSSYARVSRVQAVDDRHVVFELSEPHATFVTDLELPVLRSEDAFAPRNPDALPVASGPYQLKSRSRAALALTRNRHRTRDKGAAPDLRFVVVHDDNVRALRMLAGAGDLAQSVLPSLLLPLFERRADLTLRRAPGAGTTYLAIQLEDALLSDLRLRSALAYAIDRASLIRHKLGGRASLASSWLPEGHWAHAADTPVYAFDPQRARSLVQSARPNPRERVPLILRTSSDRSVISLARAIGSMLDEVGFQVDVRPSESATLLSDLARGRFQLALMQVPEVFEPNVLNWFFASERIPEPGVREGGNRFRLRNPELDRVLEAGRRESDLALRRAAYRTAQHILARELPMIPLWHEDVVAVVSKRLSSYRVPRDARFGTLAELD